MLQRRHPPLSVVTSKISTPKKMSSGRHDLLYCTGIVKLLIQNAFVKNNDDILNGGSKILSVIREVSNDSASIYPYPANECQVVSLLSNFFFAICHYIWEDNRYSLLQRGCAHTHRVDWADVRTRVGNESMITPPVHVSAPNQEFTCFTPLSHTVSRKLRVNILMGDFCKPLNTLLTSCSIAGVTMEQKALDNGKSPSSKTFFHQ